MKRLTKHLVVISFDGLSTSDFNYIKTLPNFKEYINNASYCKKVYSIYPSLTYPAHTTIVTGKYPKNHGVINNTFLQPNRDSPDWYWYRKYIRGETLYDLAIKNDMTVAALLWPVTAKSKIQYNVPEIFSNRPWKNQIMTSLLSGSPLFQYRLNKKFGYIREGLKQPNLDNFTHQAMLYTLKEKRPDLALVHYTELDSMRHYYGFNSKEAKEALKKHDERLGDIVKILKEEKMHDNSTIIVLGDHSSLDEDKIININVLLKENRYINVDTNGKIIDYRAIGKNCDGSTYIYTKNNNKELISQIYNLIDKFNQEHNCIEAIYTNLEAKELGADPDCALMLEANKGYYFLDNVTGKVIDEVKPDEVGQVPHITRSTHGYSPFKKDYTTVFLIAGKGIEEGIILDEMKLVDEGPTMARLLGLDLKDTEGRVIEEFLNMNKR